MGLDPISWAAIGLSAIGGGLQYSAQMSAARTQETFSTLNAQAGVQQATQQANQLALQSQLQAAQSQAAQQTAQENAAAMRGQVEADSQAAQENIRRTREEFARKLAQANAANAGSGANVATGSPLDFLLAASEQENQVEADMRWQDETARRMGFRRAAGEALGGRVEGLNATLHMLSSDAAIAEGKVRAAQARLGGLAGQSAAAGMRSQAFGGFMGDLAGLGTQYYNFRRLQLP